MATEKSEAILAVMDEQRLPNDVLRMIFELVFAADKQVALPLLRVSKPAREWIEPLFYTFIMFFGTGSKIAQFLSSDTARKRAPQVKCVWLLGLLPEQVTELLQLCTGLDSFSVITFQERYPGDPETRMDLVWNTFRSASTTRPKRISFSLDHEAIPREGEIGDFPRDILGSAFFSNVTHLNLDLPLFYIWTLDATPLPQTLTHLSLDVFVNNIRLQDAFDAATLSHIPDTLEMCVFLIYLREDDEYTLIEDAFEDIEPIFSWIQSSSVGVARIELDDDCITEHELLPKRMEKYLMAASDPSIPLQDWREYPLSRTKGTWAQARKLLQGLKKGGGDDDNDDEDEE